MNSRQWLHHQMTFRTFWSVVEVISTFLWHLLTLKKIGINVNVLYCDISNKINSNNQIIFIIHLCHLYERPLTRNLEVIQTVIFRNRMTLQEDIDGKFTSNQTIELKMYIGYAFLWQNLVPFVFILILKYIISYELLMSRSRNLMTVKSILTGVHDN